MRQLTFSFRLLSFLLVFIFGGAVVGETAALSMVVGALGADVLGKLYAVNSVLLFLLPALFFRNIDRVNRGRLLSTVLLVSSLFLVGYLVVLRVSGELFPTVRHLFLYLGYPIAYLSKTVLFLTFWTLANDICGTSEAKESFPRVAAWGFLGGLIGATIARFLLTTVEVEMIIGLWASAYFVAFLLSYRITHHYRYRLLPREQIPDEANKARRTLFRDVEDVFSIELVRLISVLYFLVFVAVFLLDYLFWNKCHLVFPSPESLASFQFSFYLAHGVTTVAGLLIVMPGIIARLGFARIFAFLPITLLIAGVGIFALETADMGMTVVFSGYVVIQFARYVVFENAFSPIYQMFFASVSREHRGRAKTMLEGVIKPSAILGAGLLLIFLGDVALWLPIFIAILALGMNYIVGKVRTTYLHGLLPEKLVSSEPNDIVAQIGSHYDQKILSLVREYSHFDDPDLRGLAVRILAHIGSRQTFRTITEIYEAENDANVREMISGSLTNFYWQETKGFAERLLEDENPRIRANAIRSLNGMNCSWKWSLRGRIRSMLFEPNVRVQIEAAQYLWRGNSDRETVEAFLRSLLKDSAANRRTAGLFLVSVLKPRGWEEILLKKLHSSSRQVYSKSVETILQSSSLSSGIEMFRRIEDLTREHITVLGKSLRRIGTDSVIELVISYLPKVRSRRMMYELVHSLRVLLGGSDVKTRRRYITRDIERLLTDWMVSELEGRYLEAYVWNSARARLRLEGGREAVDVLDDAVSGGILRAAGWALDTFALIEKRGKVSWGRRDLDLNDPSRRMDVVEIIESYGTNRLGFLVKSMLVFQSWDALARVGRSQFRFDGEARAKGIGHFVWSDNKWTCLCSLFVLYEHRESFRDIIDINRGRLDLLAKDENRYLAQAARMLNGGETEQNKMNTFELLETVLFFKKTMLFRNVSAEKLMGLAEISTLVSYERGEMISKEGDISEHLYIVRSGSLKIAKEKNGVKTILSIVRRGEAYGEIGLFNNAPRSASAVANEDCEVFVIQRSSLKRLLMEMPEIAYNFLEIFSEKLRRSGEEVALLHTTLSGRIRESV